jgi:hypothetical protein
MKLPAFVFLLLAMHTCFAQKQEETHTKSNGYCPVVDMRSDKQFLASFIGPVTKQKVKKLRTFLNSDFVKQNRSIQGKEKTNWVILDALEKIMRIDECKAATFRPNDSDFKTALDIEITKPLLQLMRENSGTCGMCFDIIYKFPATTR